MKKIKTILISALLLLISNAYSQPNCDTRIKDAKNLVSSYMKKTLGFTSTAGLKISCPGGYNTKSYRWKNIVGEKGPDDIFLVNGVATTPKSPKGGYYEIFFTLEYSCWPDADYWALDRSKWRKSFFKIETYVPHDVPGENITAKEKLDLFYSYINEGNNLTEKFRNLKDFIKIDTVFALGKVKILSPTKKEIFLHIKGHKIDDCSGNHYFTYYPQAFSDVKLGLEKENNKWVVKYGIDDDHYNGTKKFTILKPMKAKCLAIDGWNAVYKKMQITEGEFSYMSRDLADRLDDRVKAFAKMMNKELTGNEAEDIAKIKPYMFPEKADELAKAWYNLNIGGLDCGIEVKKYSFSGQVRREDKGGVRAYYNFTYYRPGAQTQEQIDLYKKCGVIETKIKSSMSKNEGGKLKVKFKNKEWYIAEFPELKYNYDGTKKGSSNSSKSKSSSKKKYKQKSLSKYFK